MAPSNSGTRMPRIVGRSHSTVAASNGSHRAASRARGAAADTGGVQSIARALTLLEALADQHGDIGIAELSRRVGLHVSTAHRILGTLVHRGYARQSAETGRYTLGAKTFHIAESYLGQVDLRRLVRPILERLSRDTGETANLVILDGREALYLDKVEGSQSLRIFSRIGRRAPLYCTAAGKVLLAGRPMDEVNSLLGGGALEALTRATVTSRRHLRQELTRVQEQGFALDIEECEDGASCIAVPVRNSRGETVAAIGISGPSLRMPAQRIQELVPAVMRSGSEASVQLGFHARPKS